MNILDRFFGIPDKDEEKELEAAEKEELQAPNFETQPAETQGNAGYIGRNVVDFNSAVSARESALAQSSTFNRSQINTIKPKDFSEVQTIANCLRDKIPVVVNFEETNTAEAKRIIDFISGTIYAVEGTIKKVSQDVFICAPNNVTVTYTDDEKKSILD